MKFRKKPVIIEAIEWDGTEFCALRISIMGDRKMEHTGKFLDIFTLEGVMRANPGDWIIRGVAGELYPCRADIFAATYEAV